MDGEPRVRSLGATLIRINVREPEVPREHIGVAQGALAALTAIDGLLQGGGLCFPSAGYGPVIRSEMSWVDEAGATRCSSAMLYPCPSGARAGPATSSPCAAALTTPGPSRPTPKR